MRLIITADLTPISERLTNLSKQMSDLKPVMSAVGGILESSTRLRISNQKKDASGQKWAALSESTLRAKRNKKGGVRGSLLVNRGMLMRSITHAASARSVIVGSNMAYARFHQEGTKNMPARPFLGLSKHDYEDVADLLDDWLNGLIGN